MSIRVFSLTTIAALVLIGCGGQTQEVANPTPSSLSEAKPAEQTQFLTTEELDAYRRSRTIDKVFHMAGGSKGNGEVMSELRTYGGELRRPEWDYDVYDTSSAHTPEELKAQIKESLDRGRVVLIDNGGTPEARAKSAAMSLQAIGAQIDAAGAMIQKAPEDKGGGYLLTPIYSKADVQDQVAKGLIPNADAQTNTVEKLFIHKTDPAGSNTVPPTKSQPTS